MKVGDYARTKKGEIGKITDMKIEDDFLLRKRYGDRIYFDNKRLCLTEDIIKTSPNIIDLIEIGDYVNGSKVLSITINNPSPLIENGVEVEDGTTYGSSFYKEEDIKSIVTKEQFKIMEYKVGE